MERFDAGTGWACPASFDDGGDRLLRAGESRFHRAVTPVAHPAAGAALERLMFDKGAETNALHPADYNNMHSYVATDGHPRHDVA